MLRQVILFGIFLISAIMAVDLNGNPDSLKFILSQAQPPDKPALEHRANPWPDQLILTLGNNPITSRNLTFRTDSNCKSPQVTLCKATPGEPQADQIKEISITTHSLTNYFDTSLYHHAEFKELTPGTKYMYRCGCDGNYTAWRQFSVPQLTDTFSILFLGDAQNDLFDTWSRLARQAFANNTDTHFALYAGDIINHGDNDYQWAEWLTATADFHSSVPLIATPGNHEYIKDNTGEKVSFSKYWDLLFQFPRNTDAPVPNRSYAFEYGQTLFVSLDSNRDLEDQAKWLEEQLKSSSAQWKVVTFHHPVFSGASGRYNEGVNTLWKPLLEKYDVDLVLNGHDHTYARGANPDVLANPAADHSPVYVVSVSGEKQYELEQQPWMFKSGAGLQLYQQIDFSPRQIHYRAFTADGTLFDEFILEKDPKGHSQLINY